LQQPGLKLVQAKGPEPVLVIDHVERPSANLEQGQKQIPPRRCGMTNKE
jgi:hypothetical protein